MLSLQDIQNAAGRLRGAVLETPCVESRTLSQITGAQVYLKFENLQFTASFKERGALNKLAQLSPEERARGVVAMSAGNHAQGVAYHAQRLGVRAVIVMPRFTPGVKVERTRGFGAEVVLHGDSWPRRASTPTHWPSSRACALSIPMTTSRSRRARAPWRWKCWPNSRIWTCWSWPLAAAA